jgi:NAD(P)H dehydrogenase (quinone)
VTTIYIPFYSRYGHTEAMALAVAEGVRQQGAQATLAYTGDPFTPAEIMARDPLWQTTHERLLATYPLASPEALASADGAVFGTPTRFGNMAAPLKGFIDTLADLWLQGRCVDKPAAVFVSTSTMHGGQETTLLTMWPPLAHLGFVLVGVPYSVPELQSTQSGGTPYGPSHLAGVQGDRPLDDTEAAICYALGQRVARMAVALGAVREGAS